jgi:hypothetical protein
MYAIFGLPFQWYALITKLKIFPSLCVNMQVVTDQFFQTPLHTTIFHRTAFYDSSIVCLFEREDFMLSASDYYKSKKLAGRLQSALRRAKSSILQSVFKGRRRRPERTSSFNRVRC